MRSRLVMAAVAAFVAGSCSDSSSPSGPNSLTLSSSTTSTMPPSGMPPPAMTTTSAPVGPRTLRRATFVSANGYVTEGTARIQVDDGEHTLELDSNFRTSNSNALDVRLCTNPDCTGEFVQLGPLQRFNGRQSYPLADAGSGYGFVTIYCLAVRLAFGYGPLQ